MIKETLCPACINCYEGEFGNEAWSRFEDKAEYELCEEHQDLNIFIESQKADIKLHEQPRSLRILD